MAGINHLHSDEPQPNLRHRCSRQQLAKGAAGRRLAVDLGDEVAHQSGLGHRTRAATKHNVLPQSTTSDFARRA